MKLASQASVQVVLQRPQHPKPWNPVPRICCRAAHIFLKAACDRRNQLSGFDDVLFGHAIWQHGCSLFLLCLPEEGHGVIICDFVLRLNYCQLYVLALTVSVLLLLQHVIERVIYNQCCNHAMGKSGCQTQLAQIRPLPLLNHSNDRTCSVVQNPKRYKNPN